MVTISYNIHDILKFKVIKDRDYGLRDMINLKFSFFEVDEVTDPDIILNIGKFVPSNNNCYIVGNKYYIKDNYIYCKDSEGRSKWEVEIIGFEEGNTIINFNGKVGGFQSIINPDIVAQLLLLTVIEYKLGMKGHFLLHAGGVSKNRRAYVFAGRGASFKSSLCMDFIRKAGFEFLGDDRIIINKNFVLSFPFNFRVFEFMCEQLPNENTWTILNKIRFAGYLMNRKDIRNTQIKVSEPSKLKGLFFIVRTNEGKIVRKEISLNEAASRLIINNMLEDCVSLTYYGINSAPYLKYSFAYSYIFPDSKIARYRKKSKKIIEKIIKGVPIYEIKIPNVYNPKVFNQIYELVMS